jgi:crossover junction endodeoxyribonuclease RusA
MWRAVSIHGHVLRRRWWTLRGEKTRKGYAGMGRAEKTPERRAAEFVVEGRPVPKKRPRVIRDGAKSYTYTPKETVVHEEKIGWAWKEKGPKAWPLDGRYAVRIDFFFAMKTTADIDNLIKSVLDGLNGLAWKDDRQVMSVRAEKMELDPGEPELTYVAVEVMED